MGIKRSTLAIGAVLLVAGCARSPGNTVKTFATESAAGHTTEALDLMDPAIKEVGGPKLIGAIEQEAKQAQVRHGLKTVDTTNAKVDGDYGTVDLKETFGDGSTQQNTVKVHHVGGKWYVTF